MATITQAITAYTGDLPDKDTMTPDEFDVAAEDFADYITDMSPELNIFAGQANALGASANDLVVALAAANYVGEWDDLTGAAAIPYCCYHDSEYWMLLAGIADVTASEPASTNADWVLYHSKPITIAKTAAHTITSTELRGHVTFTNTGAGGAIEFTLPAVSADYRVRFYVAANQYLKVTADGTEKFRWGTNQSAAGGYVRSSAIGTFWELSGASGTEWSITRIEGALKVDE